MLAPVFVGKASAQVTGVAAVPFYQNSIIINPQANKTPNVFDNGVIRVEAVPVYKLLNLQPIYTNHTTVNNPVVVNTNTGTVVTGTTGSNVSHVYCPPAKIVKTNKIAKKVYKPVYRKTNIVYAKPAIKAQTSFIAPMASKTISVPATTDIKALVKDVVKSGQNIKKTDILGTTTNNMIKGSTTAPTASNTMIKKAFNISNFINNFWTNYKANFIK
jgi:hypothetical protein